MSRTSRAFLVGALVLGLSAWSSELGTVHCAEDAASVALTLARGAENRAVGLSRIWVEFLHENFATGAVPAERAPQASLGPDAVVFQVVSDHGLYWVRAIADADRAKVETVTLKSGPPFLGVVPGVGPRQFVKMPNDRSVEADWVRSVITYDGATATQWQNTLSTLTVRPQEWSGPPASHPVFRRALMLGLGRRGLGEILAIVVAKPGARVEVAEADVDGQHEYLVRAEYTVDFGDKGQVRNQYEVAVVPDWGYAIRRYEDRHYSVQSGSGCGDLLLGTGFHNVSGTWLPSQVIGARYEYKQGEGAVESAWRTQITFATTEQATAEALFAPLPPLGAYVYDQTGSVSPELIERVGSARAMRAIEEAASAEWPSLEPRLNVLGREE